MNAAFLKMQMRRTNRRAFTLVEMLVSVALVLLMMSMFAQVFQMATGSLSQQKGIAENDQRERMLTTTIRGDLDKRTFRDVFPFRSNEDTRALGHSLTRRSGYFEIDEGDPASDVDDVLQFTALVNIKLQNTDSTPFTGKATTLSNVPITGVVDAKDFTIAGNFQSVIPANSHVWITGSSGNNGRYTVAATTFASGTTTITLNPNFPILPNVAPAVLGSVCLAENEPDFDDGVFGNGTTVSSAAEICYFLRNGILYRRVLLIREPPVGGNAQPSFANGTPLLWNSATGTENYPTVGSATTFWRDFDYSAFHFDGKTAPGPTAGSVVTMAPGIRLHSATESLSNSREAPLILLNDNVMNAVTPPISFPISLGIPHMRFGHSHATGQSQDVSNVAKLNGVITTFGRFTVQECANNGFGYPGFLPGGVSPLDRNDLTIDPGTGLISQFEGQTFRRGEDILMSNVLTFDVKVWDPDYSMFVDIGDNVNAPNGPFSSVQRGYLNSNYSFGTNHFRFDTWHPLASVGGIGEPPVVPFNFGVDQRPGVAFVDDDGDGVFDNMTELAFPGSDDRPCPISALQITINFRDISSNQVRQTTIVQSLIDSGRPQATTTEAPEE